jgi:hypothetical protein
MKKVIMLVCILGLIATGSTSPAANDARGLRIMLDIFSLLNEVSSSNSNQEEQYIEEYDFSDMIQVSISDCTTKPGLSPHTGGIILKESNCFASFTITSLSGGAENFFYKNGLRVGDLIGAFDIFNKGNIEKFSFKCNLDSDLLRQLLYNSIGDIMMDPNEPSLWIRVVDIERWPNGNLKSSMWRDFKLKY